MHYSNSAVSFEDHVSCGGSVWDACVSLYASLLRFMCCGLAVDVCRIGDVCCLPAPANQRFSSNSLDLSAPEEA